MERLGHRVRPAHRDRGRQVRVDAAHPRRRGAIGRHVGVHDLRGRVHAGVGPSGGNRRDVLLRDLAQRALERVLHAATGRLRLESAEVAAVVLDGQGDAHGPKGSHTASRPAGFPRAAGAALRRAHHGAPRIPSLDASCQDARVRIRLESPMLARAVLGPSSSPCAAASLDARAQMPGGMPTLSPAERAEASAACDSLATIPNPPMSVQACKAMLGMAGTAERMHHRPPPIRPRGAPETNALLRGDLRGDDATRRRELSSGGSAKAGAAFAEGTALASRQAVEGGTFIAGSFALGAAMGAASPVMPGFVAAAIAYAWQAQAVALGTSHAAEQAALRPRRDEAIIASRRGLRAHDDRASALRAACRARDGQALRGA